MSTIKVAPKGKLETINRYLIDEFVLIHVKPGAPGLVIPDHLAQQSSVTLKISKFFQGGMAVLDDRIEADLKFSGTYFTCIVPFETIWGVTTFKNESFIWPQDAPADVTNSVSKAPAAQLAAVKSDPESDGETTPPVNIPAQPAKASKGSHLKRIK